MNTCYKKFGWSGVLMTIFLVSLLSVTLAANDYTITQGGNSYSVTPLTKQESAESFYDYRDYEAHTNPSVELANESVLFLYRDESTGRLSLIVIHHDGQNPIDLNNYQTKEASLSFSGIPSSAQVAVQDDPEDDDYSLNSTISWNWPDYRTDGVVITDIGEEFTISIEPNFTKGINDWKIATGNINDPDYISLDMTQPLEITDQGQIPDAPSNLSGQALSSSEIELTWTDNSTDEDGFRIYRNGSSLTTVGANQTEFTDTGLSAGTTYTYRVAAYNTHGESPLSNSVDVTTDSEAGPDSEFTADKNTWNLLSVPLLPSPDDCPSVLGDDLPSGEDCGSIIWGPWDGSNFRDSDNMTMRPFEAFWLWAPSEIDLGVSGTVPSDREYTLDRTGWFMIGSPVEIDWGNVQLKENGGSYKNIKNIDATASDSPLYNSIYEYIPANDDFTVSQQPNWDDFVLDPWKGYYIYVQEGANTPITLNFGESEGPPFPSEQDREFQGTLLSSMDKDTLLKPPSPLTPNTGPGLIEVNVTSRSGGSGSEVTFEIEGEGVPFSVQSFKIKVKNSSGETLFASETTESTINWSTEGIANGIYLYVATVRGETFDETDIGKLLILN
ncbi:fibronectin type III domain-containing protein [Candidatus Bipolaricaulota bacterium]|nr:fibronectin type III domain-containing protein [Candidatus Bipolaricaulota bacterium]